MALWDVKVVHTFNTPFGLMEWDNTWCVDGDEALTGSMVAAIGGAFSTFHRGLLFSYYAVDRIVISTSAPDSRPYNPEVFATYPVALPGLETPTGVVLPLTNVIDVRKICLSGRNGHLFLRGGLATDNVVSSGGVPRLSDPAALTTAFVAAFAALQSALDGIGTVVVKSEIGGVLVGREVAALGAPVLTTSSHHRPRKARVPAGSPFAAMSSILDAIHAGSEIINPIIEIFNALPDLPDVPLLP